MIAPFGFSAPGRIVFGAGVADTLPQEAASLADHALVITGANTGRVRPLLDRLSAASIAVDVFSAAGEPDLTMAVEAGKAARAARLVIGIGGGAAIDLAKAAAAFATNTADPYEYLEVVGRGRPLDAAPLPVIAVPTTAGTGSEVTRNVVLSVPEHGVKVSLRHPALVPCLALCDPDLTLGLPPLPTAATGLDALTQVIEPFVSPMATPMTDALCADAIPRLWAALPRVLSAPGDRAARAGMMFGALCGGLALANAKLGAVHGLAAPLGARTGAAHGTLCGRLLPEVTAANLAALSPDDPALGRYERVAAMLGVSAAALPDTLRALVDSTPVPRLADMGLEPGEAPGIAAAAARSSSMKGNPVLLSEKTLTEIMHAAL